MTSSEAGDRGGRAVEARFWHRLDEGRIQCDLCPRRCRLREGQRGLCFVRRRRGDRLVLDTWGHSSGFCVDPIEKKPFHHFLPGTPVLSFGTAGCNLLCKFCQNWTISKSREIDTLSDRAPPERIAEAAERLGCRSVAFTYNDPVIFHEYAVDVARACRERGIRPVAVTAGYVCEGPRSEFYRWMDAANVDLKAFTDEFYRRWCGAALRPVLDTLRYIRHETDVWLEITTLLIPGLNDSVDELERLSAWVAEELGPDVPIHFTAFHPSFRMRDRPPTPPSLLSRARTVALGAGLRYAYTGNVVDPDGDATLCHGCRRRVMGRDWYRLTEWHLTDDGACARCGTRCAGVFEGPPGGWGARRLPVDLRDFARPAGT